MSSSASSSALPARLGAAAAFSSSSAAFARRAAPSPSAAAAVRPAPPPPPPPEKELTFRPLGFLHGFLLLRVPDGVSAAAVARLLHANFGATEHLGSLAPLSGASSSSGQAFKVTFLRQSAATAARRWLSGRRLWGASKGMEVRPLKNVGGGGGFGARDRAGTLGFGACVKMINEAAPLRWCSTVTAVHICGGGVLLTHKAKRMEKIKRDKEAKIARAASKAKANDE